MKHYKNFFFIAALFLLFSANAFAQAFEGTISMEVSQAKTGDEKMPMTISIKGDKTLMHFDSKQGPLSIYSDRAANKTTIVMHQMKMGMVQDMNANSHAATEEKSAVEATGQKKVINGYNCELYKITSGKDREQNWWMTADMPKSMLTAIKDAFAGLNGPRMHQRSSMNHEAEELFKKGLLPIQTEELQNGKVQSTATFVKYEQKKLDDALFAIPADIKIMDTGRPPMGGQ